MTISRRALIASAISFPFLARKALADPKHGPWHGDDEPGTIVIVTGDHTLHLIGEGTRTSYAIAVGREGAQWYGETHITHKRKNPEWRPTPNMRKRDPSLPAVVKPGPRNPLGTRAIYLAEGYLRIHGTNDPASIGRNASSGCFRLGRDDIEELYDLCTVGSKVYVYR